MHVRMILNDDEPEAMCEYLVRCRTKDIAQALEQFNQDFRDGKVQMPSSHDGNNPPNEVVRENVIVNYSYTIFHAICITVPRGLLSS